MAKAKPREPWIWLQENEADGKADCGCLLVADYRGQDGDSAERGSAILFCSLHEAAQELLDLARLYLSGRGTPKMLDDMARAAIANAERRP